MVDPSPDDLVEALGERYFEPRQDWRLFEIAVLMRITKGLATVGSRINPTRLFHDSRGRPFAVYKLSPVREVRVWYQAWPPATGPSVLDGAIRHYDLSSGGNRPDVVVEFVEDGESRCAIVLELKASSSGSYLSSGLGQLLGYLKDRPRLLAAPGSGWLVAPPGAGYESKPPGDCVLWVTSSSEVAGAVRAMAVGAGFGSPVQVGG
jgi:hypothetical protein